MYEIGFVQVYMDYRWLPPSERKKGADILIQDEHFRKAIVESGPTCEQKTAIFANFSYFGKLVLLTKLVEYEILMNVRLIRDQVQVLAIGTTVRVRLEPQVSWDLNHSECRLRTKELQLSIGQELQLSIGQGQKNYSLVQVRTEELYLDQFRLETEEFRLEQRNYSSVQVRTEELQLS